MIALRFGAAAIRALEAGLSGVMVVLDEPEVRYVPFSVVIGRMKQVPLNSIMLICLHDLLQALFRLMMFNNPVYGYCV
ncbi:MAG: hypothetical protein HGB14_10750 [Anaerolineaceae bacterium]|nr:hypothetical protein [Anaerolineaceae bacterium]